MSPPPPAEGFASRLLLGPALRTQSDRRLVSMVRDGYETAFEEIVRRYGRALGRYAGAIVPGHRAEDVTQDAFSKALLALRQSDAEIELRPWLYRIVRNTALNDLRDEPPAGETPEDLGEGSASAFQEVARRQEVADLMERLRALPEPQRAAIVMRELEGLSHEEIAAAMGITGGAARQVIYRARRALRDGLGILVPLPLIKLMLGGGGAASASAAGAAFGGGAGGGAGAGLAIKATAATLLVAGGVGTGVVLHEADTSPAERRATVAGKNADERATRLPAGSTAPIVDDSVGGGSVAGDDRDDEDNSGPGSSGSDDGSDSSGSGSGADDGDRDREEDREDSSGPGSGDEPDSEESGSGEPDSSGSGSDADSLETGEPDSSRSGSDGTGSDFLDSSGSGSGGSDSSGSETDLLDSSGTGSRSDAEAEAVDD